MSVTPEEAPPRPAYMRDADGLYYRIASPAIGATTIITGTGAPDGATGSTGYYYLDSDGQVLYGPKAGAYGAGQSVYTSQTPTDSGAYMSAGGWAGDITCAVAGRITGLRFYRNTSAAVTSRTLRLWHADGSLLASGMTSGETGSGWKTVTLATPVAVAAGQTVRSGHDWAVDDWASRTVGKTWPGSEITNGDLQLVKCYALPSAPGERPNTVSNAWVFADIVFEPAPPDAWPVALRSAAQEITSSTTAPSSPAVGDIWVDMN